VKTVIGACIAIALAASQASAECAWVLWSITGDTSSGTETHNIHSASASRQECDGEVRDASAVLKRNGWSVVGGFPGSHEAIGTKGTKTWRYQCLPDTIDPRGPAAPKGK
jgi:hypothetical protein